MSDTRDCGGDGAAYVLGALEPAEAEAFHRHLASCAVCRDEVAAFEQVVETLPMAARQYAVPKGLRRRVMRALRVQPHPVDPSSKRRWSGPALLRPAFALGAVAAVATAAVIAIAVSGTSGTGARVFQARVTGPGSAELRVAGGRAELIVRRLPEPPPGHIYEVWLERGQQAPSPTTTLFSVTSSGTGAVGLPQSLRGVSRVLVTAEPDGGSLVPTRAPVIVAQIT